MKKVLFTAVSLILAVVAYFGYVKYQHARFVESLVTHIKNSSLRVANSTRHEIESDSKISYKELLEKLESDVAEIDKRLLEVQTLGSPANRANTDPVVAYLKSSQEFLRTLLLKYRKQLKLNSAKNWADKFLDEYLASSPYGSGIANRAFEQALKEALKAKKEYNESIADLLTAVTKLKEVLKMVTPIVPADALLDPALLDAVAKNNASKADVPVMEEKGKPERGALGAPGRPSTPDGSREVGRDGTFIAYANGVVKDTKTGLEWIAGLDRHVTWDQAKAWIASLNVSGGGWRIPTVDELKTLYQKGTGTRNMTPLLETRGWWVWADGEVQFSFGLYRAFSGRMGVGNEAAFAVR